MKKRWFARFQWSMVVLLALTGGVVLAQPATEGQNPPAIEAPGAVAARPVGGPIDIWSDDVNNYDPAVAYNSRHGEFLVVWFDEHTTTMEIHARRVARDGTLKSDFIVPSDPNTINLYPDVAYSPAQDEYLIVYNQQRSINNYDILARRVRWDGSWISLELLVNGDPGKQWYPAVAYNGQNDEYLVVYENYKSDPMREIAARRVKASDGSLLSWCNIASAPNTIRSLPDVAYNAERNEYLIAYTYQTAPLGDGDIRGKISNADMSTLSAEMQITSSGSPHQDGVALATGPGEYLAVWGENYSASKISIWGRRVGGTGSLHSFMSLAHDDGQMRIEPAVGFGDRGRYLVTWSYFAGAGPGWDIYARTVLEGQNTPEDVEFPVDTTSGWQQLPAVGCAPLGPCLVAYLDPWPVGGDFDIRGRLVGYHHAFLPVVLRNR